MSVEELNFKKLAQDKHRVYRIMRAPAHVIGRYREHITKIGKYAGAIIFPEQFIAMGDAYVYVVSVIRTDAHSASASLRRAGPYKLYDSQNKQLFTVDDVIATEIENKTQSRGSYSTEESSTLFLLKNNSNVVTNAQITYAEESKGGTLYWFSNKKDAMSFARSQLVIA